MKKEHAAALIILALLEAIDALGSVPSGHLYAHLAGRMTLDQYQQMIGAAIAQNIISESGHVLTVTPQGRALLAYVNAARSTPQA